MPALYQDGVTVRLQGKLGIEDTIDELRVLGAEYECNFNRASTRGGEGRYAILVLDMMNRVATPWYKRDIGRLKHFSYGDEEYRMSPTCWPKDKPLTCERFVILAGETPVVTIDSDDMRTVDVELKLSEAILMSKLLRRLFRDRI